MICRGESEFMKNYSTSMGLKTIQAFSQNVLMPLLQGFIVLTTWKSLGKVKILTVTCPTSYTIIGFSPSV